MDLDGSIVGYSEFLHESSEWKNTYVIPKNAMYKFLVFLLGWKHVEK